MFRFFLILIFSIFFSANLNAHADHNKDLNKILEEINKILIINLPKEIIISYIENTEYIILLSLHNDNGSQK